MIVAREGRWGGSDGRRIDNSSGELGPEAREFYVQTLTALNASGIPFLVGGAYALERYTGIERHTKDFDLFLRQDDRDRILRTLDEQGCRTEVTFPHWLAKAYRGDHFFDLIFSSGNARRAGGRRMVRTTAWTIPCSTSRCGSSRPRR